MGVDPLQALEVVPMANTGNPMVAYTDATTGFTTEHPDAEMPFI